MRSAPRECEIKLELSNEQATRLAARLKDGGLNDGGAEHQRTLTSTYYDTSDWALRRKGISLRVRTDGSGFVQTLKCGTAISGGVSNPVEIEAVVEDGLPSVAEISDKKLRRQVERLIDKAPLMALFEVVVERTSARLTSETSDLEISLDLGHVRGTPRSEKFREAEIELRSGDPAALVGMAREIIGEGPMRPGRESKADRGYRLLGEPSRVPILAKKAQAPAITEDMTNLDALVAILITARDQVLHNWLVLEHHDEPEAAHQMRVGLRRLRTGLRILHMVDDTCLAELADSARDLGRAVGKMRDIDVLMEDVVAPLASSAAFSDGIHALQKRIKAKRRTCRATLLKEISAEPLRMIRLELGLLAPMMLHALGQDEKPLTRPVAELADKALRRLLRRVEKRGLNLSDLSIEQRHALRKAIKPLRYAIEFFAPVLPHGHTRRLISDCADLQTTLGYLNDVALAERLLALDHAKDADGAAVARAAGAVIGWHTARAEQAWQDVKAKWKRFEKSSQFLAKP